MNDSLIFFFNCLTRRDLGVNSLSDCCVSIFSSMGFSAICYFKCCWETGGLPITLCGEFTVVLAVAFFLIGPGKGVFLKGFGNSPANPAFGRTKVFLSTCLEGFVLDLKVAAVPMRIDLLFIALS